MNLIMKLYNYFFLLLIVGINLGTLLFVPLFSANLSDLGNSYGHRLYLILWGCSAALYFFYYTWKLMKHHNYSFILGKITLLLTCFCMSLSVLLPYLPYQYPYLAQWHTRLAMIGTVGYLIVFFHFLFFVMKRDVHYFQIYFTKYCTIVVFDAMLFLLLGGVTTFLEISFTIAMSTLLVCMHKATQTN